MNQFNNIPTFSIDYSYPHNSLNNNLFPSNSPMLQFEKRLDSVREVIREKINKKLGVIANREEQRNIFCHYNIEFLDGSSEGITVYNLKFNELVKHISTYENRKRIGPYDNKIRDIIFKNRNTSTVNITWNLTKKEDIQYPKKTDDLISSHQQSLSLKNWVTFTSLDAEGVTRVNYSTTGMVPGAALRLLRINYPQLFTVEVEDKINYYLIKDICNKQFGITTNMSVKNKTSRLMIDEHNEAASTSKNIHLDITWGLNLKRLIEFELKKRAFNIRAKEMLRNLGTKDLTMLTEEEKLELIASVIPTRVRKVLT